MSSVPLVARSSIARALLMSYNRHVPMGSDDETFESEFETAILDRLPTLVQSLVKRIFSTLQTYLHPASGPPNLPAASAFLNHCFPVDAWEICVRICLVELTKRHYRSLLARKAASIVTHSVSGIPPPCSAGLLTCQCLVADGRYTVAENQTIHTRLPGLFSATYQYSCKAGGVVQTSCCPTGSERYRAINDADMALAA